MTRREAPLSVLKDLAEAADEYDREMDRGGASPGAMRKALSAYRAATAPLRTRPEVDAEIARLTRDCVENEWAGGEDDYARWERVTALCREPTSEPNPSGPGGESAPSPASVTGATYSRALHDVVEELLGHIIHLEVVLLNSNIIWNGPREYRCPMPDYPSGPPTASATKESSDNAGAAGGTTIDPCSCDESEHLKQKLRDIRTEYELAVAAKKSYKDALGAIGGLLEEP